MAQDDPEDVRKAMDSLKLWRDILPALGVSACVAVIGALLSASSWSYPQAIGIMLLVIVASVSVGAMMGFLFGIPRARRGNGANDITVAPPATAVDTAPLTGSPAPPAPMYLPNTTLEDFSDRLATIIVGATLVQFETISRHLWAFGRSVPVTSVATINAVIIVSLVIIGAIGGFAPAYLWARNELPFIFRQAASDLPVRASQLSRPPITSTMSATESDPASAGTPSLLRDIWNSDPNKDAFGGQAEDKSRARKLSATWGTAPDSGQLPVTLTVESTNANVPLTKPVRFFLHPTFVPAQVDVVPSKGKASVQITLEEAFTVGAVCDDGATRLELDLEALGDFPVAFRANPAL